MEIWHSATRMKQLATGVLAVALAAIALAYFASRKSIEIQGPGALQAIAADSAWLGVDEELWVLDAEGHRQARRSVRELGLTAGISNIVPAPDGQALLTTREDAHWQVVDRATLATVRTIRPQWPEGFEDNRSAIHLAISPEGDIAVATGGGHTVLLFDRDGRLLARTAPGTYRFTNGLWWSAQGWWTTDTNRFALRLLDARTLATRDAVALRAEPAGYPYLGEAQASQGRPRPGTQEAPVATLTRLGYLMDPGHAVDVFADGSQLVYNQQPFARLRDLSWFGGKLLLVDGATFTIQRFGPDRIAEGTFGDAQVQTELQRRLAQRQFWGTLGSRYFFLLAALLLVAGIAAHVRQQRLAARAVIAAREGGQTVAQAAPLRELALQRLWIYGLPIAVRIVVAALAIVLGYWPLRARVLGPASHDPLAAFTLLLLCIYVPILPVAFWQQWRHRRLSEQARYEPALNHHAIAWLRSHADFDRVKLEGEVPRETVYVAGWRARWLLVTNRRVLLFAASARERRLLSEWPRRSVAYAGPPEDAPGARRSFWPAVLRYPPNLVLVFTTGTTLRLRCASGCAARRVADLLRSSPPLPDPFAEAPPRAERPRARWREVVASALVPGTGQWLQGRFATGTVLFTAALLLTAFGWGPVAWAMHGPKMDVSAFSIASAAFVWVALVLAATADAWRFSATRR